MPTCGDCFFCIIKYDKAPGPPYRGTCYQAQRVVLLSMTACALLKERKPTMPIKSTKEKRNKYRDKDDNVMLGMTLPEVVDKPLTILAKREYTWGLYEGMAVKVKNPEGKLAIVEITADIPIKALNEPKLPPMPYKAKFVQKTSANKRKYYTIEVIEDEGELDEWEADVEKLQF